MDIPFCQFLVIHDTRAVVWYAEVVGPDGTSVLPIDCVLSIYSLRKVYEGDA